MLLHPLAFRFPGEKRLTLLYSTKYLSVELFLLGMPKFHAILAREALAVNPHNGLYLAANTPIEYDLTFIRRDFHMPKGEQNA